MTAEALVVIVGETRCALPMERVLEVRLYDGATRVPGAPSWMCGIIEREGKPVEVFDARRRLRGAGASPAIPPALRRPGTAERSCVIFFDHAAMLVEDVDRVVPLDSIDPDCTLIDVDAFFGEDA